MDNLQLFETPAQAVDEGKLHACAGSACSVCHTADPKGHGQTYAASAKLEWVARANDWLSCLEAGSVVSSDDLVAAVGLPAGELSTRGNNACGAVFSSWARQGLIRRVGYVNSKRKSSHGTVISQWQVL